MSGGLEGIAGVLGVALREMGLSDKPAEFDSDIHSWRCSHPDIYGPCDCFAEVTTHVAAAVVAWIEGVLAGVEVRDAVADVLPLGYTARDPHANVYESADAALAAVADVLRGA